MEKTTDRINPAVMVATRPRIYPAKILPSAFKRRIRFCHSRPMMPMHAPGRPGRLLLQVKLGLFFEHSTVQLMPRCDEVLC
jgi:hypothetical protein